MSLLRKSLHTLLESFGRTNGTIDFWPLATAASVEASIGLIWVQESSMALRPFQQALVTIPPARICPGRSKNRNRRLIGLGEQSTALQWLQSSSRQPTIRPE